MQRRRWTSAHSCRPDAVRLCSLALSSTGCCVNQGGREVRVLNSALRVGGLGRHEVGFSQFVMPQLMAQAGDQLAGADSRRRVLAPFGYRMEDVATDAVATAPASLRAGRPRADGRPAHVAIITIAAPWGATARPAASGMRAEPAGLLKRTQLDPGQATLFHALRSDSPPRNEANWARAGAATAASRPPHSIRSRNPQAPGGACWRAAVLMKRTQFGCVHAGGRVSPRGPVPSTPPACRPDRRSPPPARPGPSGRATGWPPSTIGRSRGR